MMVSWFKLSLLSLLYFVQGAPYGFQSACLPIILRSQGLSYTALGVLKLLFLPWICKPLYAPLIDKTKTRKWWLQTSMSALGLTCLMTSLSVQETDIFSLSFILVLLNLFSSVQDISVDSLAVDILDENELGAGNTVQVVAYKFGSMFAGSLLLFVRESFGWSVMFMFFGSIYFVVVFLLNFIKIKDHKHKSHVENENQQDWKIKEELLHLFRQDGTLWMTFFVLFYKLCERSEQSFALFLVDQKVPTDELAMLSTAIRGHSIFGSFLSGALLTTYKPQKIIRIFAILRFIGICGLTSVIGFWSESLSFKYFGYFSICLTSVGAGAVTTATFTMMMSLSQKSPIQATHYSFLATCEVLGKLLFAALAGWLIDVFGLLRIFYLFTLLALGVVPVIHYAPQSVMMSNKMRQN